MSSEKNVHSKYNGKIIRKILIEGNSYTKDKVIRREICLFPGNKYYQGLVLKSKENLSSLYYFDKIEFKVIEIDSEHIDLVIIIEEKARISRLAHLLSAAK